MTEEPARHALATALAADPTGLDNFVIRGDALVDSELTRFDLIDGMASDVVGDVRRFAEALIGKEFLDYDPSYQTSSSQVLVEKLERHSGTVSPG